MTVFDIGSFENSDLFRISIFGFRIFKEFLINHAFWAYPKAGRFAPGYFIVFLPVLYFGQNPENQTIS